MSNEELSRRAFLRAGTVAASSVAVVAGLAACGSGSKSGGSGSGATAKPPTYQAYHGTKPDLPGNTAGLYNGFINYPAKPVKAIPTPPGKGKRVTMLCQLNTGSTIPMSKNQRWQALNKALGTEMNLIGAYGADFNPKVQTTLAGGDLPDLLQVTSIPQLPSLLKAKFQNLNDYLSGDAVKDYPFLAALPADTWKSVSFDGGIYGVPDPIANTGRVIYLRTDLLKKAGAPTEFSNAKDVMAAAKAVTDKKANRYGFGADPSTWLVPVFQQMMGVPNGWHNDGGKLTSSIEAPETKDAIDAVRSMWVQGSIHPDSMTATSENSPWFSGGTTAMIVDSLSNWVNRYLGVIAAGTAADVISVVRPPKASGGGPSAQWLTSPIYSFTALKKADKSRVKELLSVLNWMAAPFGTQEYLLKVYGIAGRNYHLVNGNPVVSKTPETLTSMLYVTRPAPQWYEAGHPDVTKRQYTLQQQIIADSVPNPTLGLYSETQETVGGKLAKVIQDAQNGIIAGRKPISSWDDAVASWKSGGGDKIRTEYQQALQKAH